MMTRTDYRHLSELSITEIETIFAGYESLVAALEAQTHTWRQPLAARDARTNRPRGFARLFTLRTKVAKHR